MQIIDAHVHPFVTPEQRMGRHSGFVTDMDYFVEDLQRAGITHCCGSVIERLNVSSWEDVRRLNDQALEIGERYPDFYTPGFHIHPAFPVESCEEIERMSAKGVKLIGELVWYMMGWEQYADPRLREAFELAAQKGSSLALTCLGIVLGFKLVEMLFRTAWPQAPESKEEKGGPSCR